MQTAYYAQVSDPRFGGMYMSLFNTVGNLGHNIYVAPSLKLIDITSKKQCMLSMFCAGLICRGEQILLPQCNTHQQFDQCTKLGGSCVTLQNGFG